jgi:hypothetical protein
MLLQTAVIFGPPQTTEALIACCRLAAAVEPTKIKLVADTVQTAKELIKQLDSTDVELETPGVCALLPCTVDNEDDVQLFLSSRLTRPSEGAFIRVWHSSFTGGDPTWNHKLGYVEQRIRFLGMPYYMVVLDDPVMACANLLMRLGIT